MVFAISCGEDDEPAPTFAAPTVSQPTVGDQAVGATGTATFNVTVDSDLTATWAATTTGGVSLTAASGSVSGSTVAVEYTATAAGAASITLTVTDSEGGKANNTAVINVLAADDALPTISGIPANATITQGESLEVTGVTLGAEDGLGTFSFSLSDVSGTEITADSEDLSAEGTSYTDDLALDDVAVLAAGTYTLLFTLTDGNGSSVSFTHTLVVQARTPIVVSENITTDVTWTAPNVYVLAGRVAVEDGASLTIEAGVIVKGEAGTGANATALIIAQGGQIFANGTADAPIIFTSVADEIQPGQIASPNLDPDIDGLWGGLIVLGRAPSSFSTNDATFQIEGIPPSDINGLYGGSDPDDNSGVIRYISIRHGGSNIGEGNEINGLTLGGVGSGTVIEYVEVIANQDDGIEWFGGTVDVANAVVWNSGDDALDTDQAWAGTMDNFIIIAGPTTDHALEIDGPEGDFRDGHTITNGTIKGFSSAELADFRDGAEGTFSNLYFFGFSDPATTNGRGDFSLSGDATLANFASGALVFSNLEVTPADGVALNTIFRNGTDVHATEVALGSNTVGANKAAFAGWSWSAVSGQLDDL